LRCRPFPSPRARQRCRSTLLPTPLSSSPSGLFLSLSSSLLPFFPSGDHRASGAALDQAFAGRFAGDDRPPVTGGFSQTAIMSLACLVCHGMNSPSHSLRSYSVSSSEEESRCGAAVACLARRVMPAGTSSVGTSKVTPFPPMVTGQGTESAPRLQRSRAVSRDLVRDWNFDEVILAN
ncbi:unnamed protein product, partial [Urochloa humidicola]